MIFNVTDTFGITNSRTSAGNNYVPCLELELNHVRFRNFAMRNRFPVNYFGDNISNS